MAVTMMAARSTPPARLRADEAKEYRLLFMASFVIFLIVAVVARLLPPQWRPYPLGAEGSRSIINEAKTAANTFIPLVFMG